MKFEYINQLFQVEDVHGTRQWAARIKNGQVFTLSEYLDALGSGGWELMAFVVESTAHRDHHMYVGYQRTNPTSARAIFKRRVE